MTTLGTTSSQIRKYAGYIPGGLPATSAMSDLDGIPTVKALSSFGATNIIQKILFVSETNSTLPATLSIAKRATAGYSNKSTAGYILGGELGGGGPQSSIEKLLFAGETVSTLSTSLNTTIFALAGASNDNVAGYTFGGFTVSLPTNAINRMPFSTETNTIISADIGTARHNSGAVSNGPTAIYNYSGLDNTSIPVSSIRKLTLSNDSISTLAATLASPEMWGRYGISNVGNSGYIMHLGGSPAIFMNTSSKLVYSNETTSSFILGLLMSMASQWSAQFTNSNIAGYSIGGRLWNSSNTDNATSQVMKLPFSTESLSVISSLTTWIRQSQGFSHSA